jgi:hypothetical protein
VVALRGQLGIDDARDRPVSVVKLHADQSRRLELDDQTIRIADNKLAHKPPQKGRLAAARSKSAAHSRSRTAIFRAGSCRKSVIISSGSTRSSSP